MYKKEFLNNKMQVITYQNNNIHSVNMSFYFKAGVEYETKDVKGISHLIEHLCFRNLNGMDQETLYNKISSIGGNLRGATYKDFIRFDITVVNKYCSDAFDIIKNLINNRDWTSKEISDEKRVVLNQIEAKGVKSFSEYIESIYYKNLNLQNLIMGNKSDVRKLTVEDINKWKRNFLNAANACFVLTGDFSEEQRTEIINQLRLLPNNEYNLKKIPQIPKNFKNRNSKSDNIIETSWDMSDISVSLDVDIDKDNIHSVEILNNIIGGGVDSNISLELREKKAYTDEVFANTDIYKDTAKIVIELSVLNRNLLKTLDILFRILQRIKYLIYDGEFTNNKVFFLDNKITLLDDARELNFNLGWKDFILEKEAGDINDIISKYNKVSIEDIFDLASKVINEKNLVISVTNNSNIVKPSELKKTLLRCREYIDAKTNSKDLNNMLINEFPELNKEIMDEISWQDGLYTGSHVVYGDVLVPYLRKCIDNQNEIKVIQILNFLENVLQYNEKYSGEVVTLSVLEALYFEYPNCELLNKNYGTNCRKELKALDIFYTNASKRYNKEKQ